MLMKYAAAPAIINELERNLKLWEDCLRFLTVKTDDKVDMAQLAELQRLHKKPATAAPPEEVEVGLPEDEDIEEEPEEEIYEEPPEDEDEKPDVDGEEIK